MFAAPGRRILFFLFVAKLGSLHTLKQTCFCTQASLKVPINVRSIISWKSALAVDAPLGPVLEIDSCNLTKRLPARAKAELGRRKSRAPSPGCTDAQESPSGTLMPSVVFPPSAPLVHFFSSFNQSARLRPDPPSPRLSSSRHSSPLSVSDRCPTLFCLVEQPV